MKTIIAPTDFSQASNNACIYAAKLALDMKADLLLFHVMELPLSVAEYPVTDDLFDEAEIEKELETLKNMLTSVTNEKLNIRTKNIMGSPDYEIKELCKTAHPLAVVMATHTTSLVDRFFLGSTTVYAAKHLQYPVIVVPHNASYRGIKKIALATDLQNIFELPAHEIENVVKLFGAKLEIFYVAKNEKLINQNSVGSVLLDHRLSNLQPQFYFLKNDDVLTGISSTIKEHKADLLVIIPKKHGPFHKSKLKDFVFYSDIPIMALHENDAAENL